MTLELVGITAGYGGTTVLRDVTLTVPTGTVVALLGPNGAGKTTLLRVAAGLLRPTRGEIRLGDHILGGSPQSHAAAGLCHIPEGRGVFRGLTVMENLTLQRPGGPPQDALDRVFGVFPALAQRRGQVAASLSGGEQQMLALARAITAGPKVVLCDEVSMGLAPLLVDEIFDALRHLASHGTSLLLVEQFVSRALSLADFVYLLDRGRIDTCGEASEFDERALAQRYLGTGV